MFVEYLEQQVGRKLTRQQIVDLLYAALEYKEQYNGRSTYDYIDLAIEDSKR